MLGENLTNAAICPLNLGTKERQLRNSDLAMTYYLMFSGYGIAAVIFSTEVSALSLKGLDYYTLILVTYAIPGHFQMFQPSIESE